MIVDAIINATMAILQGLLDLLPDVTPPDLTGAVQAIDGIAAYTGWLNKYFPVTEAVALLATVLTVYTGMYVIKFALWVWSKIPVIGGGE
jgi:hypothetical protein